MTAKQRFMAAIERRIPDTGHRQQKSLSTMRTSEERIDPLIVEVWLRGSSSYLLRMKALQNSASRAWSS